MILFQIKKSFFDAWDNLLSLLVVNIGLTLVYVVEGILAYGILAGVASGTPASLTELAILLALHVVSSIITGASAWFLNAIADSDRPRARDFLAGIKKTAGRSALFGALSFLALAIFFVSFRFYLGMGGFLGIFLAGFLGWILAFGALAFQWFFPVMVRLEGSFPRVVKKCFMITVDNLRYSIFIFFWHALGIVVSFFTVGFVPGFGGLLLSGIEGIRIRAYKYEWLEKNPGAKRSAVPWDELIKEDEDLVGPRSLKGMIFPWKDAKK